MKLLNNKIFIILLIVGLVMGLLALAQFLNTDTVVGNTEYKSDNPQYNAIRKEVETMSKKPWDKTTYYRIKNSIKDYKETKQIDAKMEKELSTLLTNKYLLLLAEAVQQFCAKESDMTKWNDLQGETVGFSNNKDVKPTSALLEEYRYLRAVAFEAEKYGKNEQFDQQRSSQYETYLTSLPAKLYLKDNPTIQIEVQKGLEALGMVSGLDGRFRKTDFKTCDCASQFGRNKYYKEACDKAQAENGH